MSETVAKVNLVVNQSGNAGKVMKDVGKAAQDASKAQRDYGEAAKRSTTMATDGERRLQAELKRTQGELDRVNRGAGRMGAGGRMGGAGGEWALAGEWAARGAFGVGGLGPMMLMSKMSQISDGLVQANKVMQDPYFTSSQKRETAVQAIVPGASTYRSAQDMVTGVTTELGKMAREFNKELAAMIYKMQESRLRSEHGFKIAGAEAGQTAMWNNPYSPVKFIDKAARGGQLAYAEEQARHAAGMGLTRAERDEEAARRTRDYQRGAVGGMLPGIEKRIREAEQRYKKGETTFNNAERYEANNNWLEGTGKGGRQRGANEMLIASNTLLDLQKQKREEINRLAESEANFSEKSSAARKAGISVMQTEMQLLQQREQRAAGSAGRLGNMNRGERMQAAQIAEYASKHGWENMSPQMRSMLAGIAPNAASAMAERSGEGSAEMRRMRQLAGRDKDFEMDFGGGPLAELRARGHKMAVDIQQKIVIDEEKLASELTARLKGVFGDIIKVVMAEMQEQQRNLVAGETQRRAGE